MACSPAGQKTGISSYDQEQAARSCSQMTGVIGEDMQVPELGVVFIMGRDKVAECSVDDRGVMIVEVF